MNISNIFMTLLLVAPFLVVFLVFQQKDNNWRRSILSSAIVWGVLITVSTEFLNLFSAIHVRAMTGLWLAINTTAIFILYRLVSIYKLRRQIKDHVANWTSLIQADGLLRAALICLIPILLLTGIVALVVPPNTADSMTYHMARVMYWMQHQSVEHYPTYNPRQLDLAPWSSFAFMHLQILSGGDRFANFIQWFSMIGSLVGVSLIAQLLGTGLRGQILSTILCATIPMGLLQATTTQNDYAVSFWLVCLVCNFLLFIEGKNSTRVSIEFGLSLGLAILTKATAYVFAFPFVIVWILVAYGKTGFKAKFLKLSALAFIPAITLNIGHWYRNFEIFGAPMGVSGDVTRNHLFTPDAIISIFVRNAVLHLSVPYQPINNFLETSVVLLHKLIDIDIRDPRTTFLGFPFQVPIMGESTPIFLIEDISGNPITLVLALVAIALFGLLFKNCQGRKLAGYLCSLLVGAVLFSIILAWQPWATRIHLPFFVLMTPFIGLVLSQTVERLGSRFNGLSYVLVIVLFLSSVPYLLFSSPRPILNSNLFITHKPPIFQQSRLEGYFNASPQLRGQYYRAVEAVAQQSCYDIGLYTSGNGWEYPLLPVFNAQAPAASVRFKSVFFDNPPQEPFFADNPSHRISMADDFTPCAVFALNILEMDDTLSLNEPGLDQPIAYEKIVNEEYVQVFTKK